MNTRRHPRTMAEAFGPYTDNTLHPMPEQHDYSPAWWAAMVVIAAVTVILIFSTR